MNTLSHLATRLGTFETQLLNHLPVGRGTIDSAGPLLVGSVTLMLCFALAMYRLVGSPRV
ncbi:MAG TPA: hypothetical protein VKV34_08355 [Thermoleophilia bacterium]|nr:hypothetical protein [Thermoleophilia bacterium]